VLADDVAVLACQKTIREVDGSEITTIEGLAQNGR
jgi:aerobic-type carbon monoxide dehydrogenase small subunit (CoxS/CutS family)